jgi:N-dimethylarginine dimethylaminohydrolase
MTVSISGPGEPITLDIATSLAPTRMPTTRRYLMCPPTYFTVEYAINPWMDPTRPTSTTLAVEQWTALKETYERLGHEVNVIEPVSGLPDMVFSANSGTVIDGRVLGSHFRRWFLGAGYKSVVMPTAVNEAEGDFTWTGSLLLAGTGFRTDPHAHSEAQEVLGVPVVSLQLVDPRFYHLDVALFMLDDQSPSPLVAYYPEAFSPGSQQVLRRLFPDAVIANDDDAVCLGLNAVSDGKHVVMPVEATHLAEQVARRGFEPVLVDISELRKSGGGPKCCTMELRG